MSQRRADLGLTSGRLAREDAMVVLLRVTVLLSVLWFAAPAFGEVTGSTGPIYINTSFENASPLYWETDAAGVIHVYLVYDQERSSPNRANGHWFFEVQATPDTKCTLVLHNFDNVWNGRKGSPISDRTICYVSGDARTWRLAPARKTDDNCMQIELEIDSGSLYVARLEPYRLCDLEAFEERIRGDRRVQITAVGKTVQGRELEIIRVGDPNAPYRVFLRARAHPWEAGGNWVVEGLVERLLRDDHDAKRYLDRYCVYVMPMANKDGVVRGWTRFNQLGADLNRKWDQPPDPAVNPENHALEGWLRSVIAAGRIPHLLIDLHNDEGGQLHISRPNVDLDLYLKNMQRLEAMLREYTWFTEGSTGASFRNPGSIGEGLLERFGVNACVLELNANWIAGLNTPASAVRWKLFGNQLCEAIFQYFDVRPDR